MLFYNGVIKCDEILVVNKRDLYGDIFGFVKRDMLEIFGYGIFFMQIKYFGFIFVEYFDVFIVGL